MSLQRLIVIMALAALAMLGAAQHATAQTPPIAQPSQPPPPRYARPRIEINPAAAALSALRRLVRAAIPAERHGALSANALLVGARLKNRVHFHSRTSTKCPAIAAAAAMAGDTRWVRPL